MHIWRSLTSTFDPQGTGDQRQRYMISRCATCPNSDPLAREESVIDFQNAIKKGFAAIAKQVGEGKENKASTKGAVVAVEPFDDGPGEAPVHLSLRFSRQCSGKICWQ